MPTRRTFLITGLAGGAALATAYRMHGQRAQPAAQVLAPGAIDEDAIAVLLAIVPPMLEGALPRDAPRAVAIRATVDGVAQAIRGLPAVTQQELAELFALLSWAPTRIALAGLTTAWDQASPAAANAVLERLRTSRIGLLRSAYDGLHQLIFAAWYGNPRAWAATGYAGPPALDA